MKLRNIESLSLWEKIFYLEELLREICEQTTGEERINSYLNLTIQQVKVIRKIRFLTNTSRKDISLKDLAKELRVSSAAASELVNKMVKKKVLKRKQNKKDRRSVCITLAGEVEKDIDKFYKYLNTVTEEFTKHLDSESLTSPIAFINKYIEHIEKIREERDDVLQT